MVPASAKTILSYCIIAFLAYSGTILFHSKVPIDESSIENNESNVKNLRGGSKELKDFLIQKAIRRRAVKVAVLAVFGRYAYSNYNSAIIKAISASLTNLQYSDQGRAIYNEFLEKNLIEKVNPYSVVNSGYPFVNRLKARHHLRIVQKHASKLLKLGVSNGKIKLLIILLFLLWYLITAGLIPYSAGVAALSEYCTNEGIEESVADALIEIFIEGPEELALAL